MVLEAVLDWLSSVWALLLGVAKRFYYWALFLASDYFDLLE
jgi:hypothetical protein